MAFKATYKYSGWETSNTQEYDSHRPEYRRVYACRICGTPYESKEEAEHCGNAGIFNAKDDSGNEIFVDDFVSIDIVGIGKVIGLKEDGHFRYPIILQVNFSSGVKFEINGKGKRIYKISKEQLKKIPDLLELMESDW